MEITWGGVLGMLGIGAFGYWLGKKALPKVKRIEETEHLRALANKIQEAAQSPEHCREADAILREIDEYIDKGIASEDTEATDEGLLTKWKGRLKKLNPLKFGRSQKATEANEAPSCKRTSAVNVQ